MKNKITIETSNDQIHFYLTTAEFGKLYLYSRKFTKGVYDYFRSGRMESELYTFHHWNRNPALDKVISRLPSYIKYAIREANEDKLVDIHSYESACSSMWIPESA